MGAVFVPEKKFPGTVQILSNFVARVAGGLIEGSSAAGWGFADFLSLDGHGPLRGSRISGEKRPEAQSAFSRDTPQWKIPYSPPELLIAKNPLYSPVSVVRHHLNRFGSGGWEESVSIKLAEPEIVTDVGFFRSTQIRKFLHPDWVDPEEVPEKVVYIENQKSVLKLNEMDSFGRRRVGGGLLKPKVS